MQACRIRLRRKHRSSIEAIQRVNNSKPLPSIGSSYNWKQICQNTAPELKGSGEVSERLAGQHQERTSHKDLGKQRPLAI